MTTADLLTFPALLAAAISFRISAIGWASDLSLFIFSAALVAACLFLGGDSALTGDASLELSGLLGNDSTTFFLSLLLRLLTVLGAIPVASFKSSNGSAFADDSVLRFGLGSVESCVDVDDVDDVRDLLSAPRPRRVVGLTNGSG